MLYLHHQIADPLGLHLQLAVLLSSEAQRWRSQITLVTNQASYDAKDLMAMIQVGLKNGEDLDLEISGPDEHTAQQSLKDLIRDF